MRWMAVTGPGCLPWVGGGLAGDRGCYIMIHLEGGFIGLILIAILSTLKGVISYNGNCFHYKYHECNFKIVGSGFNSLFYKY